MGDIIGYLLMTVLVVGIFTSVRFCVRKFREFSSTRSDRTETPAPVRAMPRVRVRVLEREPEPEPEPEIIEVISPMEALPPPSGSIVRRVMR